MLHWAYLRSCTLGCLFVCCGVAYVANPQTSFLCALLGVPDALRCKFDRTFDGAATGMQRLRNELASLTAALNTEYRRQPTAATASVDSSSVSSANPEEIALDDTVWSDDDDSIVSDANTHTSGAGSVNPEEMDISDILDAPPVDTGSTTATATANSEEIDLDAL